MANVPQISDFMPVAIKLHAIAAMIVSSGSEHAGMLQRWRYTDRADMGGTASMLDSMVIGALPKDRAAALMRRMRAECGVTDFCVFVSEAWVKLLGRDEPVEVPVGGVEAMPGRTEAVVIRFFGKGFEYQAIWPITRPANTLGWAPLADGSKDIGRFALTPRAES